MPVQTLVSETHANSRKWFISDTLPKVSLHTLAILYGELGSEVDHTLLSFLLQGCKLRFVGATVDFAQLIPVNLLF